MTHSVDLQTLADTHDEPFIVLDREYRIRSANKAFEEVFKFKLGEVIGKHCYEVSHFGTLPCRLSEEHCPHLAVFSLDKASICEHTHFDTDGCLHRVKIKFFPLHAHEDEVFVGLSIRSFANRIEAIKRQGQQLAGSSPVFLHCLERLHTAAQSDMPALIAGETGTGKQLAADFIHRSSGRRERPFVTVDCMLLSEDLFERELFGCEREGAERPGLIELADGGTLFLDEVSELPRSLQGKLLRVIETGEFKRLGSSKVQKADIRVICATNRNLGGLMRRGDFRKDLYYRIAGMTITMPPLRDRRDDIPAIAGELLAQLSMKSKTAYRITAEALRSLAEHDYPGNVRELRNVLYDAAMTAADGVIGTVTIHKSVDHGPEDHEAPPAGREKSGTASGQPVSINDAEARHIAATLKKVKGSRREAARVLGVSERTLYRKIERYGIE